MTRTPRRTGRRIEPQWVIGLVVLALGVVTVIQGIAFTNRAEDLARCQQAYSNAFADAIDARQHASRNAQRAMDTLVAAIGTRLAHPERDTPTVQRAIENYLDQRRAYTTQQHRNPYPPPPRDLCPLQD